MSSVQRESTKQVPSEVAVDTGSSRVVKDDALQDVPPIVQVPSDPAPNASISIKQPTDPKSSIPQRPNEASTGTGTAAQLESSDELSNREGQDTVGDSCSGTPGKEQPG